MIIVGLCAKSEAQLTKSSENAECFFVKEREALVVMIGFRLS